MHWIDSAIVFGYLAVVLGIGVHFLRRQSRVDEYFVGDRRMGAGHIGLSVVATDVGGGFSIGLGGLGFAMGLAGSWLLFTGLVGAWMAAVLLIPRVKRLGDEHGLLTYPQFLEMRYDRRIRLLAALISAVGYGGFVGAQVLAGAKLGAAVFRLDLTTAVLGMAAIVIVYTSFGGLQAVIYTDTVQWLVLLLGLSLFALPFGYAAVGGIDGMRAALPPEHFGLLHPELTLSRFATWMLTIVPIWFVGMTLYQRIYAARDEATARRAWYLAGLLEWPAMAFLGVVLGMMARVLYPEVESEMGLPMLIRDVLPVGVVGIVAAAYFSAIMSTADSCLLASVGNLVNDLYQGWVDPRAPERRVLWLGRLLTLLVGAASVSVALAVPKVLDAIMLAYAFMVSGLFAPTIGGLLSPRVSSRAALASILLGGGASVLLTAVPALCPLSDPILVAMPLSFLALIAGTLFWPRAVTDGGAGPRRAVGR